MSAEFLEKTPRQDLGVFLKISKFYFTSNNSTSKTKVEPAGIAGDGEESP